MYRKFSRIKLGDPVDGWSVLFSWADTSDPEYDKIVRCICSDETGKRRGQSFQIDKFLFASDSVGNRELWLNREDARQCWYVLAHAGWIVQEPLVEEDQSD